MASDCVTDLFEQTTKSFIVVIVEVVVIVVVILINLTTGEENYSAIIE